MEHLKGYGGINFSKELLYRKDLQILQKEEMM